MQTEVTEMFYICCLCFDHQSLLFQTSSHGTLLRQLHLSHLLEEVVSPLSVPHMPIVQSMGLQIATTKNVLSSVVVKLMSLT